MGRNLPNRSIFQCDFWVLSCTIYFQVLHCKHHLELQGWAGDVGLLTTWEPIEWWSRLCHENYLQRKQWGALETYQKEMKQNKPEMKCFKVNSSCQFDWMRPNNLNCSLSASMRFISISLTITASINQPRSFWGTEKPWKGVWPNLDICFILSSYGKAELSVECLQFNQSFEAGVEMQARWISALVKWNSMLSVNIAEFEH